MPKNFLFWVDAAAYPLIALWVASQVAWGWGAVALVLAGLVLFTLAEYWVHRSVLHVWTHHVAHGRHHAHPEEYTVLWSVPLIFLVLWLVAPAPLFLGFTLMYVWFYMWHHLLHHVDLARLPLVRRYASWHLVHHRHTRYNFGITSPVWDLVFGTYRAGESVWGSTLVMPSSVTLLVSED